MDGRLGSGRVVVVGNVKYSVEYTRTLWAVGVDDRRLIGARGAEGTMQQ